MTASAALPLPTASNGRLPLPYLLLAAALHLLLLLSLPQRSAMPLAAPDALQVHVQAFVQHPAPIPAIANTPATPATTGKPGHRDPADTTDSTPAAAPDSAPQISSDGMLSNAARNQIRQEARQRSAYQQAQRYGFLETAGDEKASALGRALQKTGAGEKRLANGIIQITNADGSVYCLQATSDLRQRDTPVALLAVPSTCP